jgi:hypothetical protein
MYAQLSTDHVGKCCASSAEREQLGEATLQFPGIAPLRCGNGRVVAHVKIEEVVTDATIDTGPHAATSASGWLQG